MKVAIVNNLVQSPVPAGLSIAALPAHMVAFEGNREKSCLLPHSLRCTSSLCCAPATAAGLVVLLNYHIPR